MAVYVIVIVAVVVLLVAAYRSLGGAARPAPDTATLMQTVGRQLRASLDALGAAASAPAGTADDALVRTAQQATATAQHWLSLVPPVAELTDAQAEARTLFAAAAEDTGWACRMLRASGASPGLGAASQALLTHAGDCCAAAEDLLGRDGLPPGGEPRDGA